MESWRNRKTLILGRTDMIGLLTPAEYVDCVEHAFRMHGLGRVYMEPKGHIVLDRYRGEWEVMPSWIEEPEAAACKWVSIREDNARYDLPAVFSILVYTHPETGFPLAICDARSISPDDFVVNERRYPNRIGQTYAITYNPEHRWYWLPRMRREEALVFKVYDSSKDGRARWSAHTAFDDPTSPPNARPRESIEIRTLAFF